MSNKWGGRSGRMHVMSTILFSQSFLDDYNKDLHVFFQLRLAAESAIDLRDHPFSTYAKFSKKLTFLTSWYVCVSGGTKYQFFGKFCVCTK